MTLFRIRYDRLPRLAVCMAACTLVVYQVAQLDTIRQLQWDAPVVSQKITMKTKSTGKRIESTSASA